MDRIQRQMSRHQAPQVLTLAELISASGQRSQSAQAKQQLESSEPVDAVEVNVLYFKNKIPPHAGWYELSSRISDLKSNLMQPPSGRGLMIRLTVQNEFGTSITCGDDQLLAAFASAHSPPAVLTFWASWTHSDSDCAHTFPKGHGCRKKTCIAKSCKLCHRHQCWKGHTDVVDDPCISDSSPALKRKVGTGSERSKLRCQGTLVALALLAMAFFVRSRLVVRSGGPLRSVPRLEQNHSLRFSYFMRKVSVLARQFCAA